MFTISYSQQFEFSTLEDVFKFGEIMRENKIDKSEVNVSQIAKSIGKSRDTVYRYLNGFEKTNTRKRKSKVDKFASEIEKLFRTKSTKIKTMKAMYDYLVRENPGEVDFKENTFRYYINSRYEGEFKKQKANSSTRFETDPGQQAQFDFKEDYSIQTVSGEKLTIQVAALQLGYSRFLFRSIIPDKTTDSVIQFMIDCFNKIGYVPKQIVIDNAKCLVDKPRYKDVPAVFNKKFEQFANDFGFELFACMPYRACTKGKIEKTMNKFDDLDIYDGDIKDLLDMNILVNQLTKEFNYRKNDATQFPPELLLSNEYEKMNTLPSEAIIKSYTTKYERPIKVDSTGMVKHGNSFYSVPYALVGKQVHKQISADKLYIYYSGIVISIHKVTGAIINKYNYHDPTYKSNSKFVNSQIESNFELQQNDIALQAIKNLQKVGEL